MHHRWELQEVQDGTEVTVEQWVDGLLIRFLKSSVRKTVDRSAEEWLSGLKAGAEAGVPESGGRRG